MMPAPVSIALPAALLFMAFFLRPARDLSQSVGGAKQGNAMEETSGEVHWETHDTRIALCKYAGIVFDRIS